MRKMKKIPRLPESELAIMQIIWAAVPPVSRQDIEKTMEGSRHLASTTILTLLTRLAERGFLTVEKKGRVNYYSPRITEREYLAAASRNILDRLYGGSLTNFAMALCDSGLKKEEIEELREMLERGDL